jgi:hypothetical protein
MSHDPEAPGAWARARASLRIPGALIRIVRRDPHHVPERLTIYSVEHQADDARAWAERVRAAGTDRPLAADEQRRRTISIGRIDGAISGTPFFIALVPAYVAFLRQEMRLHLRVAALYGHDPADPRVAADFLVLRGVRKTSDEALAELEAVRATPLPEAGQRTPLRSWYRAVINVLVLAGFLSPPDDDGTSATTWQKIVGAIRFTIAGLVWAVTWIVPITFMMVMSWACESDAKRFGERVVTHFAEPGDDIALKMATADRKSGGNRLINVARAGIVVLSVAIPLALIGSTLLKNNGPLGIQISTAGAALLALTLVISMSVLAVRG